MRPGKYFRAVQLFLVCLLAASPIFLFAQAYPPNGPGIPTVALTGSAPVQEPPPNPPDQQSQWNMELVGHSDLQGRSAYQPIIINESGHEIAFVGHHTGSAMNPLTGAVEPNGTSIVDVSDPANPKYLAHIPGSTQAGEEAGGAQMVRVCSGNVLPHGVRGKWYLLRPLGTEAQEIYDVTDPAHPSRLTVIVEGLTGTHKNWWECDTGITYLVGNKSSEGWKGGNHMKIYDLSDPAKPVYIRDFGLLGQQPGATSHEGLIPAIGIHGPMSAGVEKNRVYAAYGTGANGVIQILDRKKLLTAFENPMKPTTEEMLAPQVGYITMSPDQGAHTTFPVFGVPIPEFQGHTALKKRDLLIVREGTTVCPIPTGRVRHLTWRSCWTSALKLLRGRLLRFACLKIRETIAGGAGGSARIQWLNRFIRLITESWPSFPGLMPGLAFLIFAIRLPCRRSPISFPRRIRTRCSSARME